MLIVSVNDTKKHLRIEHDEEDDVIKRLLMQAQAKAETYCRVSFDDMDEIPEDARLAVLLMASHYYENRDNPDNEKYVVMQRAFEDLLYPYRDPAKMF